MKNISKILTLLLAIFFIGTACDDDDGNGMGNDPLTVTEVAAETDELSSLVAALQKAGLATTLEEEQEVTVFAPTNEAFNDFLGALDGYSSLDDFQSDAEIALLRNILLNHVLEVQLPSAMVETGYTTTLATGPDGANLSMFANADNGVTLNGVAEVIDPDIEASNGVIHVVDAVIELPTVVTFATADPTFSSLVAALTRSDQPDFVGVLSGENNAPFTVFTPTNDAFASLLASNSDWNELADIPGDLLTSVLNHHVIPQTNVRSSELPDAYTTPPTLEGDALIITTPGSDGAVAEVNDGSGNTDIPVTVVDVQATNGVVHVVGEVLIPDTTN